MKLSHAASRLRTAIAELRRAIGVGFGALLGGWLITEIKIYANTERKNSGSRMDKNVRTATAEKRNRAHVVSRNRNGRPVVQGG
jgi:hypothetical protein